MIIKPCHWCSFQDDCTERVEIRNKILSCNSKGHTLRTCTITCKKYFDQLEFGDRVETTYPVYRGDDLDDREFDICIAYGIFIGWHKSKKAIIFLDETDEKEYSILASPKITDVYLIYPRNHRGGQTLVKSEEPYKVELERCYISNWFHRKGERHLCGNCRNVDRDEFDKWIKDPGFFEGISIESDMDIDCDPF